MDTRIIIPKNAKELLDTLHSSGYKAYVVGGCVRDSILGRVPNDWDICTSALPEEVIKIFSHKRVIETGLEHGTVTVLCDKEPFEITTFRVDGNYTDSRRPDSVSFTSSIEQDLLRRDFTVNAMAYNDTDGLVDPYGGEEDLKNKIIRCVGCAKTRFEEDALRILRAIRFGCQLEFDIEEETANQIHLQKDSLKKISAEGLRVELCKMLVCPTFYQKLVQYSDVLGVFIPELCKMVGFEQNNPHHLYDVFMHTVHALKNCPSYETETRLAVLLHDMGKPPCYTVDEKGIGHFYNHAKISHEISKKVLTDLKFDNNTLKNVTELVLYHDAPIEATPKSVKKWLGRLGEQQLRRLIDVKESDNRAQAPQFMEERVRKLSEIRQLIDEIIAENECFSLKDLAVNGNDLIECGFKAGKQIGTILSELLDNVISENVPNEKHSLLTLAKELFPQ